MQRNLQKLWWVRRRVNLKEGSGKAKVIVPILKTKLNKYHQFSDHNTVDHKIQEFFQKLESASDWKWEWNIPYILLDYLFLIPLTLTSASLVSWSFHRANKFLVLVNHLSLIQLLNSCQLPHQFLGLHHATHQAPVPFQSSYSFICYHQHSPKIHCLSSFLP